MIVELSSASIRSQEKWNIEKMESLVLTLIREKELHWGHGK